MTPDDRYLEVRQALDQFLAAFGALDFERFAGSFAQNAETCIILPAPAQRLIYRGWTAARQAWLEVFEHERAASPDGRLRLEISDLDIQVFGESALATFLVNSLPPAVMHRRTIVFAKQAGRWQIVHLHGSNHDPT